MNKLLKHKKIIVFSLVFILSFGIFADYKKKEAQAFVLEFFITQEILWALGTLVLATGVVAVGGDQILDMGQRVVDRINDNAKLRGQVVFDGAVAVGLKIDSFIKDAVAWVAENLPAEDVYASKNLPVTNKLTFKATSFPYTDSHIAEEMYNASAKIGTFTVHGLFRINGMNVPMAKNAPITFTIGSLNHEGIGNIAYFFYCDNGVWKWSNGIQSNNIDIDFLGDAVVSDVIGYTPIPYSNPSIKENYNEGNLPVALPYNETKQGYIPIPIEVPDTVVTPDLPLTWDNVKDTVIPLPVDSIDVPSIPDVGEYELPSDLPLDNTGDITKGGILGGITDFFSFLWELLKALLMGIYNLLKAILDLLLGLVNALLTGLKDLLMYLFVPSDTYFTDVFSDFKNDLFNRLDITSYTRLFDTDYTESSIKDITINVFGQTVTIVKFSIYEDFRAIVNTLIYAFMFFLLAIYNYNQIYKLIRGSDYVSASTTITHIGGGLTPGEQIKADSINRRLKKL